MAITALLCGVFGIISGFIPILSGAALPASILALVFGVIGRSSSDSHGLANGGIICGIVGVLLNMGDCGWLICGACSFIVCA